ncbi:hypothetical protein F0562_000268 [Nyssa sinensis]|uniref:Uncharacterized protein n=1 Tax=Nyssa sinensis TaxID=561372 RepID=A0A5J5C148_9ASTE|nr:hypothetical protein F0562_000268 [Nyssa sinensis]
MSCLASCCASLTCGLCTSVASGISKRSARLAYCGIFGISLILSWILREVGAPLLEKIPWINTSHTQSKEWFQMEAVLRVSLGNFLFFATFALIMIGVKDQNDRRDSWHHGGWTAKIVIWVLLIILMFFLPNVVVTIYGILSKFGAGLFLLAQVIILLDATHSWNDAWVAKDEQKWYIALLSVSVTCYLAAFAFSGILFIWFNPSGHDCRSQRLLHCHDHDSCICIWCYRIASKGMENNFFFDAPMFYIFVTTAPPPPPLLSLLIFVSSCYNM